MAAKTTDSTETVFFRENLVVKGLIKKSDRNDAVTRKKNVKHNQLTHGTIQHPCPIHPNRLESSKSTDDST